MTAETTSPTIAPERCAWCGRRPSSPAPPGGFSWTPPPGEVCSLECRRKDCARRTDGAHHFTHGREICAFCGYHQRMSKYSPAGEVWLTAPPPETWISPPRDFYREGPHWQPFDIPTPAARDLLGVLSSAPIAHVGFYVASPYPPHVYTFERLPLKSSPCAPLPAMASTNIMQGPAIARMLRALRLRSARESLARLYPPVAFESARDEDLAALWSLQSQCYPPELWDEISPATLREYTVIVARQEGQVIGAALGRFDQDPDRGRLFELYSVEVRPGFERRGIARRLVIELLIVADAAESYARAISDGGRALCSALGFVDTGEREDVSGHEAWIMRRSAEADR